MVKISELLHSRCVGGLIESPDVGEDKPLEFTCGHLFKDPTAKLAYESIERWTTKGEDAQDQFYGEMVVEQLEPGALSQLVPNSHLADSGRTNDEEQSWFGHVLKAEKSNVRLQGPALRGPAGAPMVNRRSARTFSSARVRELKPVPEAFGNRPGLHDLH